MSSLGAFVEGGIVSGIQAVDERIKQDHIFKQNMTIEEFRAQKDKELSDAKLEFEAEQRELDREATISLENMAWTRDLIKTKLTHQLTVARDNNNAEQAKELAVYENYLSMNSDIAVSTWQAGMEIINKEQTADLFPSIQNMVMEQNPDLSTQESATLASAILAGSSANILPRGTSSGTTDTTLRKTSDVIGNNIKPLTSTIAEHLGIPDGVLPTTDSSGAIAPSNYLDIIQTDVRKYASKLSPEQKKTTLAKWATVSKALKRYGELDGKKDGYLEWVQMPGAEVLHDVLMGGSSSGLVAPAPQSTTSTSTTNTDPVLSTPTPPFVEGDAAAEVPEETGIIAPTPSVPDSSSKPEDIERAVRELEKAYNTIPTTETDSEVIRMADLVIANVLARGATQETINALIDKAIVSQTDDSTLIAKVKRVIQEKLNHQSA